MNAKVVSALCLFVLACILVAGLWPFHTPRNAVSWVADGNGLRFDGHGAAMSASVLHTSRSPNENGFSIEIWLTPAGTKDGSILAIDSSPDSRIPFLLRQYGTGIALQRYLVEDQGQVTHPWFKVENVFSGGKRVFLTITSDKSNPKLYVDGTLAGTSSDPGIISRELIGRLVLANSTDDDSWTGDVTGLAIYGRQLDSSEVVRHVQTWTRGEGASLVTDPSLTALYTFQEREGRSVRNLVDSRTSLTIPTKYFVLHHAFLRPTWEQYRYVRYFWNRWSLWEDLAVNVFGFMPVGFVFFAYFSSVKRIGHPVLVVVLLGFFLSFTVEALQWFLPTRDSGMTDLFSNTSGTALGALLYQCSPVRTLWTRILGFVVPCESRRSK